MQLVHRLLLKKIEDFTEKYLGLVTLRGENTNKRGNTENVKKKTFGQIMSEWAYTLKTKVLKKLLIKMFNEKLFLFQDVD